MNPIPPITEDDIVQFLVNSPGFFERHAELLASIQLTSPHGQRAVSLQERQAEMLRDKIRHLEHKAVDMIRHGQENVSIADRLQTWTCRLLAARDAQSLPGLLVQGLESDFGVPQAAIRVWGVDEVHAAEPYAAGVSAEARLFATSLTVPYCGPNPGLEAATWLADAGSAVSVALVPLREAAATAAFGLLVLASPDAQRFQASMGTDFLERIGELASAALLRLQPPAAASVV